MSHTRPFTDILTRLRSVGLRPTRQRMALARLLLEGGDRHVSAEALHGGMSQEQRDRVMGRVRSGTAELLVATDVAARGLDIDQLTKRALQELGSSRQEFVHVHGLGIERLPSRERQQPAGK